jgi:hypothetical protein
VVTAACFFSAGGPWGGKLPAFPAPSDFEGGRFAKLGRGWRREAADVHPQDAV